MINILKLQNELLAAGLPVEGVSLSAACGGSITSVVYPDCRIDHSRELNPAEAESEAALLAAHQPVQYSLSPAWQAIIANGLHTARLSLAVTYVEPLPLEDLISVNGVEQSITLQDGRAELSFTSSTPGEVLRLVYHDQYALIEAR